MLQDNDLAITEKISPPFQSRLRSLPANASVRALVMLGIDGVNSSSTPPRTREERQAIAQAIRATAMTALPEIDAILDMFSGKRLAEHPNALGSILVETTKAGIQALAASDRVQTILEDQSIRALTLRKTA